MATIPNFGFAAGDRTGEWDYDPFGMTLDRPIIADGRPANIHSVNEDGNGVTSITFHELRVDVEYNGAHVRIVQPGLGADGLIFGKVMGVAGTPVSTLLFDDAALDIYNAVNGGAAFTVSRKTLCVFRVRGWRHPFYSGLWGGKVSTVSYSGMTDETTITGPFGGVIGGGFAPVSVGAGDGALGCSLGRRTLPTAL